MSFSAERLHMVVVLVPAEINGHDVGLLHNFDRVKLPYTDILRPAASGPGPSIPKYQSGLISSMERMKLDSGSGGGKAPQLAKPAPKLDPKEVEDRKKHNDIIKKSSAMKRIGPGVSLAFPRIKSRDGKKELVYDPKTKRSVMKVVVKTAEATKPQPTSGLPVKGVASGYACTKSTQKFAKASELETHKKTHK
ncbi:hypothetical protein KVR01_000886 [Diaporthe batatas]|uniref:uncharacterized protein n=1 Tax=Diaporthe batatas TaxID=748121 RepID=UPI001D03E833|nr:uncharacterized protein KVR01_000886 [Diaporthe batatas]KAG8170141.1 hypothetical protein KVR01_000886 [Diaporthe batatas]